MTDPKTAKEAGDVSQTSEMTYIKSQIRSVNKIKDDFTAEQMAFVKGLINPDLNNSELLLFLGYANTIKLNPFNKEIIAVVYSKDKPEYRRVNTIVTRDGKRVVASRAGDLEDIATEAIYIKTATDGTTIECNPWEGKLWGARSNVKRKGKIFTSIVPLTEYNTNQSVWATKPSTMIKKVAESQALTAAFPEILGGVYDEAEMSPMVEVKPVPTIENGADKANDSQLTTLESLGADMSRPYTKQEAVDEIARIMSTPKKGVK
jgi:phage recombination protein Bet